MDQLKTPHSHPGCTFSSVLVVGAGLAGVAAALAAAEADAQVAIACAGRLFGGSSFRPTTWGLGLVAPDGPEDEDDLARTIVDVGGGVADEALVNSFVGGIAPAVAWLESRGVRLKRPDNPGEREFVPCFDHKHRRWYGLEREPVEAALGKRIADLGITVHSDWELLDIRPAGDQAAGAGGFSALFLDAASGRPQTVSCRSIVLATGGSGGLFERHLGAAEDTGAGHACALRLGARLTNMEFMQIMPGLVGRGQGTVFNEKVFRWTQLLDEAGTDAVAPFAKALGATTGEVMGARSGHGPFTSRLISRAADMALDAAGPQGLRANVRLPEGTALPEFARTYFQWLWETRGVSADDEMRVAPFAHANNGGIAIDERGSTGVEGLFACGECTGGMHGADRLGGLSSANCLVFGLRAGKEAARHAAKNSTATRPSLPEAWRPLLSQEPADKRVAREALQHVRSIMERACMIDRSEAALAEAHRQLTEMREAVEHATRVESLQIANLATAALAVVDAARARTESLGSHHRTDGEDGDSR
uniref:L-aspartate oxidase n=1 Tax=Muribaculaceae bacterium Z82 TaxID=2304548 RepID=A0A7C9JCF2_9BACT